MRDESLSLISVVIVSFNASDHLRRCLATIFEHQRGHFEVIVVDNASPDDSSAMVEAEFPDAVLLRNSTNAGFAAAANRGAAAARGDVIAFLNPDSELRDDVFSPVADYLRAHQKIGAAGLKVLNPDGTLQLSVRRFPGLEAALFNRYSIFTRLWPRNRFSRRYLMSDWDHAAIAPVDWVSGACVVTRRDVLDRVGYFDPAYFWGFEDVDFCQRLHRAGMEVVYFPESSVIHAIGASARTAPARALIARHRGMWRYYKRWLSPNPVVDAAVFAGIWMRCGLQLASGWLMARKMQTGSQD